MKYTPVCIDDELLYIADLATSGKDVSKDLKFTENDLKKAFSPIMKFGKNLKEGMQELAPDEIEISMQVSLSIENNKFIFGLVNLASEAQFSVKYSWKKDGP